MKIILKEDIKAEVDIFLYFLDDKEYPWHKEVIFSCFPDLKEKLDSKKENRKVVVRKFLEIAKIKNKDNIEKSIIFIKNEVEKHGEKTLEILVNLMDCKIKTKRANYFLIPTIYPLCPFLGNTFFYSIYESLKGKTKYSNVLAVSVHEISHIIFLNILQDEKIKLGQELCYFVKELVAPILVCQDDFKDCFDNKKELVGNYDVLEIYFKYDGKKIKAFDYFLEMFAKNRAEHQKFNVFLRNMINICVKIESEIKEKRTFSDKYGLRIIKEPKLLKELRKPIKLR